MTAQTPNIRSRRDTLISQAQGVLNRTVYFESAQLAKLHRELESFDLHPYAAEVLLFKMRQDEDENITIADAAMLKQHQLLARYIYKDQSLPSSYKYEKAISILKRNCGLDASTDFETLGLAGAVYKKKWEYDRLIKNLEMSQFYYQRGYELWKAQRPVEAWEGKKGFGDDGWNAINYAFVSELMAVSKLEETGAVLGVSPRIRHLLDEAEKTRRDVLTYFRQPETGIPALPEFVNNWTIATIAEAYFGTKNYVAAEAALQVYLKKQNDPDLAPEDNRRQIAWKIRSTASQFRSIANLQLFQKEWVSMKRPADQSLHDCAAAIEPGKIASCLHVLSNPGSKTPSERKADVCMEKMGLALSGGGFRASLYHIGVLAALAEYDLLKDLEVISCVSGGSILGMYYYLKLKQQMENPANLNADSGDLQIDYVKIVAEIERDFPAAIKKNIRMRVFANPIRNIMMMQRDYSRTHRLGELYEEHLYSGIIQKNGKAAKFMNDLLMSPADDGDFNIMTDNWKRVHKIPQLILNATSVNTGHNFQFTASWMGEPAGYIQPEIDVKPRLRRMYYKDAPAEYQSFPIGKAVGASSCVPVLFEPLPMYNLYQDENSNPVKLQLIDGGLHDNQGIASLLEQECRSMIISDASGQMGTSVVEVGNELSLFYRSDTIVQERIREVQFMDLKERKNTSQLQGYFPFHLKHGLQKKPWTWITCRDQLRKIFDQDTIPPNGSGILREAQTLISQVRTDLDAFHDVEAAAIMCCGYAQTIEKLRGSRHVRTERQWKFLKVLPYLQMEDEFQKIKKPLTVASRVGLKVFHLNPAARVFAFIALVGLLAAVGILLYREWGTTLTFGVAVKAAVVATGLFVIGLISQKLLMLLDLNSVLLRKLVWIGIATGGAFACGIYLLIFNRLYLRSGRFPKSSSSNARDGDDLQNARAGDPPIEKEEMTTV